MTIEEHADVLSQRVAALYDDDAEFRAAEPLPAVLTAARSPGLRLVQVLQTLMAREIDLSNISIHSPTLEDVFLVLTGKSLRE